MTIDRMKGTHTMPALVFAADLFAPGPEYVPPAIHHDDPRVMALARILCTTDPEHATIKRDPWEYLNDGANQDSAYYADPYRRAIAGYIAQAERMLDALRAEGWIA